MAVPTFYARLEDLDFELSVLRVVPPLFVHLLNMTMEELRNRIRQLEAQRPQLQLQENIDKILDPVEAGDVKPIHNTNLDLLNSFASSLPRPPYTNPYGTVLHYISQLMETLQARGDADGVKEMRVLFDNASEISCRNRGCPPMDPIFKIPPIARDCLERSLEVCGLDDFSRSICRVMSEVLDAKPEA